MKTLFSSKTLIALAVAIAAAAAIETEANEQPIPPPSAESTLPAGVTPGSPAAQVIKLVQAGVDASVIQVYISNCPTAFNLDADKIIALTDAGLPGDYVNMMFDHDKRFLSSLSTSAPAAPAASSPAPVVASSPPPTQPPPAPPQEVTVNYFYQNLSPYGSWVEVDGYGRCWRPNIVVYDSSWRPYCDRGRWVYTDCGWYWDSDYSWGVTFHYGRWFCDARYGWCWWPDTVWAPSWVTWRSSNDYCGWAPLPPYTVYNVGAGFCYRGNNVAVSFDFGLASSCFTFVSVGNFCQPHPRQYCVPPTQVNNFYNSTVVINNFGCNQKTICNNGVSVTVIGNGSHRPIQAVPVHSMGGGRRSGGPAFRYYGTDNQNGSQNRQFTGTDSRHNPPPINDRNNGANRPPANNGNPPSSSINPGSNEQNRHVFAGVNRKPIKLANDTNPSQPNMPDRSNNGTIDQRSPGNTTGNNGFIRPVPGSGNNGQTANSNRDLNRNQPIASNPVRQPIPSSLTQTTPQPSSTGTMKPAQNNAQQNRAFFATQRPSQRTESPAPSRSFTSQSSINPAPAVSFDRPQRSDNRQPMNSFPGRGYAPTPSIGSGSAPQFSGNGNNLGNPKLQNWLAQNH